MIRRLIVPFLLIPTFFVFLPESKAAVVDKVLAVVNDELITQAELDRILIPVYEQYKTIYRGEELILKMDEARRNVFNQMIIDKLLLCEARKRGIMIVPGVIEEKIEEFKGKFSSEQDFQETLIDQGLTLADLQKRFEEELLKEKFVDMQIRSRVVITPTEISKHYNENIDRFKIDPQAEALNIFIRIREEEQRQEAYNRAEEIIKRLKEGEDFSELAKAYSDATDAKDGGYMGYISKGQLKKELDEAVFSLEVGKASDIIESDVGYHIFMVLNRKEELVLTLEEVYNKIRDVVYRQKAKTKFEELIKELKKNAYISIK